MARWIAPDMTVLACAAEQLQSDLQLRVAEKRVLPLGWSACVRPVLMARLQPRVLPSNQHPVRFRPLATLVTGMLTYAAVDPVECHLKSARRRNCRRLAILLTRLCYTNFQSPNHT